MTFQGQKPFFTNDTFIAPTASVIGNVTNWDQSSVWYKAVVRADAHHDITIGFCSSIGEGSVLTTCPASVSALPETGFPPELVVGHYVTIGSGCVLKSCRIDDLVLIGDGCTIQEGALVESQAMLESGSNVLPYQRIPSGQKWGGNPAQYVADLTPEELQKAKKQALQIHELARQHQLEFLPYGYSHVHMEQVEEQALKESGGAPTTTTTTTSGSK